MDKRFEVNQEASLADIGAIINETLNYHDEGDHDSVRNNLLGVHYIIYPNASRTETPDETRIRINMGILDSLVDAYGITDTLKAIREVKARRDTKQDPEPVAPPATYLLTIAETSDTLDSVKDRLCILSNLFALRQDATELTLTKKQMNAYYFFVESLERDLDVALLNCLAEVRHHASVR